LRGRRTRLTWKCRPTDDLGTRIKENGLVEVLQEAVVDYTRATGQTINQPALRECLYAVVERFCTRHATSAEWHDTFTRPMCGPRPQIDPVRSILDL
jgi:hypothetical protein